ncbi:MAG: hypothetical protein ACF8R7_11160 [Phycisphaerales bacterium JB039]
MQVAVHWRVDAASLRRAAHWDHPGADVTLTIALTPGPEGARIEATLSAGAASCALNLPDELAAPDCMITECDGLLHIDAPPALTATIEAAPRPRALYAATAILSLLGLAGGRYEVAGAALRRAGAA